MSNPRAGGDLPARRSIRDIVAIVVCGVAILLSIVIPLTAADPLPSLVSAGLQVVVVIAGAILGVLFGRDLKSSQLQDRLSFDQHHAAMATRQLLDLMQFLGSSISRSQRRKDVMVGGSDTSAITVLEDDVRQSLQLAATAVENWRSLSESGVTQELRDYSTRAARLVVVDQEEVQGE